MPTLLRWRKSILEHYDWINLDNLYSVFLLRNTVCKFYCRFLKPRKYFSEFWKTLLIFIVKMAVAWILLTNAKKIGRKPCVESETFTCYSTYRDAQTEQTILKQSRPVFRFIFKCCVLSVKPYSKYMNQLPKSEKPTTKRLRKRFKSKIKLTEFKLWFMLRHIMGVHLQSKQISLNNFILNTSHIEIHQFFICPCCSFSYSTQVNGVLSIALWLYI